MTNTIITHQDLFGAIWAMGWLFTIGYLGLTPKKSIFGLIVWPYYLGVKFRNHPK